VPLPQRIGTHPDHMEVSVLAHNNSLVTGLAYEVPVIDDLGRLSDITAGCVGGVPDDSLAGADTENFPADSGLFCQ
jgi:hypothetical protein